MFLYCCFETRWKDEMNTVSLRMYLYAGDLIKDWFSKESNVPVILVRTAEEYYQHVWIKSSNNLFENKQTNKQTKKEYNGKTNNHFVIVESIVWSIRICTFFPFLFQKIKTKRNDTKWNEMRWKITFTREFFSILTRNVFFLIYRTLLQHPMQRECKRLFLFTRSCLKAQLQLLKSQLTHCWDTKLLTLTVITLQENHCSIWLLQCSFSVTLWSTNTWKLTTKQFLLICLWICIGWEEISYGTRNLFLL